MKHITSLENLSLVTGAGITFDQVLTSSKVIGGVVGGAVGFFACLVSPPFTGTTTPDQVIACTVAGSGIGALSGEKLVDVGSYVIDRML